MVNTHLHNEKTASRLNQTRGNNDAGACGSCLGYRLHYRHTTLCDTKSAIVCGTLKQRDGIVHWGFHFHGNCRDLAWRPGQNCQDTTTGVQCIDTWLDHRNWSLVLVNFGLWDTTNTPVDIYIEQLKTILDHIPQRVVFVTSTPRRNELGQPTGIVSMYNSAVQPLLTELNITQCDLYSTVQLACTSVCYSDSVHFTSDAYAHILAPAIDVCIDHHG